MSAASEFAEAQEKLKAMRDLRNYEQGFRDGMSANHKMPMTFQFMGYSMEQLTKIICDHEALQPTKVGFLTDKYPNGLIIEVDGKPVYQK